MKDFGAKPELAWLPISKISVEPKYQRDTGSIRSRNLIKKIVENFRWPRFGAILVVKIKGGGWHVIDGQHRCEAARLLEILHVPAIELPHSSVAEAAADFVAINRDRVVVTPLHIHYAMLAADEPEALAVARVCKAVGITICRYPIPSNLLKDGQTLAVGTIRSLVIKRGEAGALKVLTEVVRKCGRGAGAINAKVIRETALELGLDANRRGSMNSKPLAVSKGAKQRWCLNCRQPFASTGAGHRICDDCKSTSNHREGAMAS